jgi:hypothetical protein
MFHNSGRAFGVRLETTLTGLAGAVKPELLHPGSISSRNILTRMSAARLVDPLMENKEPDQAPKSAIREPFYSGRKVANAAYSPNRINLYASYS